MSDVLTPKSRLMQGVIPYIAVASADDAIVFYERAFGAVVRGEITRGPDGRVMNVSLEINGGALMLMTKCRIVACRRPSAATASRCRS